MYGEWKEVKIVIDKGAISTVEAILYSLDIKGLSIEDPDDIKDRDNNPLAWDFADINIFKEGPDKAVIKCYLPDNDKVAEKVDFIRERLKEEEKAGFIFKDYRLEILDVNEEDWANSWKKHYKPMRVGKNLVIRPSWEDYEKKEGDIVIDMDPGMAFGTGTHETTRMCLEALEDIVKEDMEVVDVGTGSGILAIAAAKLGANKVLALDLDPVAVDSAKINKELNKVRQMEVKEGNMTDLVEDKADLVIANIIADVIIIIADDLKRILKKGGYFIASGIIDFRLKDVINKLENIGLTIIEAKNENDWRCIIAKMN